MQNRRRRMRNDQFKNHDIFEKFCFTPYQMHQKKGDYFRFISSGFIHGDFAHLLFNMLTLYFFGKVLEEHIFSQTQYVLFYFSALFFSGLNTYIKQKNNPDYRACGASGAVSAIIFSMVLFQPWSIVYLKFFIPIYFILFAIAYLVYSYYMSNKDASKIAHDVHLWGALYGIAFTLILRPESLSIFKEQIQHVPFLK